MRRLLTIPAAALLAIGLATPACPQSKDAVPPAPTTSAADPPPKVRELLDLVGDPQVRAWLDQQKGPGGVKAGAVSRDAAPPPGGAAELDALVGRLGEMHAHVAVLIAAVPHMSEDFRAAEEMLAGEFQGRELWRMLRLLVLFVGLGCGMEWLFRRSTTRFRARIEDVRLETIGERLRVVGARVAFAVGLVLSFAVGSVGAFLAFDWPPLPRSFCLVISWRFWHSGSPCRPAASSWRQAAAAEPMFRASASCR